MRGVAVGATLGAGAGPRGRAARSAAVAGHPEPDAPRSLADVELAEPARAQLRHERGEELVGEAVDRRVVGAPLVGRPRVGRAGGRIGVERAPRRIGVVVGHS